MDPTIGPTNGQGNTKKQRIGEDHDEWDTHSVTKSYYRMKASQAQEYVKDLRQNKARVELEKLEDDELRIEKNRARLSKNTNTRKLQKELKVSFQNWCDEVKTTGRAKGKNVGLSGPDRQWLVKPTICAELDQVLQGVGADDDPAHDMNAYFMFFKKVGQEWEGENYRGQRFPKYESFPNQRISVHDALYDDTYNPFAIHEDNGERYLRYIHLPANHIGWIEDAMARYHDEHNKDVGDRVKTNKTLSREFWRGQLHGSGLGRKPIHATHMRSRCSVVPAATQSLFGEQKESSINPGPRDSAQNTKSSRKDLAIFMPYLHWEMSGRRARMAKAVKEMLEEDAKNTNPRDRGRRAGTIKQDLEKYKNLLHVKSHELETREMARKMMKKTINPTKLGQYLLSLAQLWDAMDMELDERMVKKELISPNTRGKAREPRLHIRRTLDQSYFLKLKDTSERDLDQVVFRATKHQATNTRVVMVDQLWLWVLDEHTVITAFPKRWGRNKPDSSGIHKSLRERMLRTDKKVMSAWHLASIIIDQCSNVFFDRTRPLDDRPEVMDIFAETLGDVNHYTTVAFKVFWHSVDVFAKSRDKRGSHRQSQRYLDINPEGMLLKEAQDIVEELKIMIGIYSQQLVVVKNFQKFLEHMNGDPKTRSRPPHFAKALQHLAELAIGHGTLSQANKDKPVSLAEMEFLEDLVEEVENRKSEIMDLESAALQSCQQLQDLLSLKQQQASIVEAKAALDRADQSVEQGKAIMAFTIITIIFTPLGFFTSFFGMNNALTGAEWMTLDSQCMYMFCISAAIIISAFSLVFKGSQLRQSLQPLTDPKARWNDLKSRWQAKDSKSSGKTAGNKDQSQANRTNHARDIGDAEGRSNGTNSAKHYFGLSGMQRSSRWSNLTSRNNRTRSDVENSIPMQTCENGRSKTTDE